MEFIDLFSGIGGFRSALQMNGHECLAFAEIDKYARQNGTADKDKGYV
ncbi:DNA cytosine methyltransferase [Mammaliicoccus sciuri]